MIPWFGSDGRLRARTWLQPPRVLTPITDDAPGHALSTLVLGGGLPSSLGVFLGKRATMVWIVGSRTTRGAMLLSTCIPTRWPAIGCEFIVRNKWAI